MIENSFWISSAWGPRADSPAGIGDKALRTLDALSGIDPVFHRWWLVDFRGKGGFPLDEARPRIAEIVESGVSRDDSGDPEPQGGYSVTALNNPMATPRSISVRMHGGWTTVSRWLPRPNSVVLSTEIGLFPDPAIVTYPIFRSAMAVIASIWNVDYAVASPSELTRQWTGRPRSFRYSWITYLSPPLARQITPPSGILCERTEDGGLLLIATKETFDVANPDHMAAARTISEALTELNDPEDLRPTSPWRPR